MKTLHMKMPIIVLAMMATAALSSFAPAAQADEYSPWSLNTSVVLVDAGNAYSIEHPSGGQLQANGDQEIGLGIAIGYELNDLISLELARVTETTMKVDYAIGGDQERIGNGVNFTPITLGANFHLGGSERFDLYAGPRVAYVNFDGFNYNVDGQDGVVKADNEIGWGATAGLKYRFGQSAWSLLFEATYLDVDLNLKDRYTGESSKNDFNPLMLTVGLAHRF